MKLVKSSYAIYDVEILLQDMKGKVKELDNRQREILRNKGIHYSEMLPIEYVPTEDYYKIFEDSLDNLSLETANAVAILSEKLWEEKGKDVVLVSLARAGTPIGILIKRYLKYKYNVSVPHFSISIIRDKGIDIAAMDYITNKYPSKNIQFIDGWVGKGAINKVLEDSCNYLKTINEKYKDLDDRLAVLTDPAYVTDLYGTRKDFLIPSACLNSTVSGLISRTVKTKKMTDEEFHGAVYYEENEDKDESYSFINKVVELFDKVEPNFFNDSDNYEGIKGIDEVEEISKKYNIPDINKIKPGVGETTRVLLRRVPNKILISKKAPKKYIEHILQLAKEKNIPIEYYPFKKYYVCGLIKDLADL